MQLEAVLFALILFFIIPIIIVFSNDNVFFIIISLLLLINAFKNINIFNNSRKRTNISNNSEFQEEFQQITNIDYKVFTAGLKVAGNFIFIIFFIYCIFFINEIIFKILSVIVLFYWVTNSFNIISSTKSLTNFYLNNFYSLPKNIFKSLIGIFTIIIIFYVASIKFL